MSSGPHGPIFFNNPFIKHFDVTNKNLCFLIVGWEGGDEWIRLQFRIYLQALLATVKYGG